MKLTPSNVTRGSDNTIPYFPIPSLRTAEGIFFTLNYPLQFQLYDGVTGGTGITTGQNDPFVEWTPIGRNLHAVQVASHAAGTFGSSVLLEGSLDGVHWFTIDTITVAGIKQYTGLYQSLRTSITAYTGTTPIEVRAISQKG